MQHVQKLLQNVAIIQNKYDEIAKITGENFNVFSVMNMEYKEVNTHSAIIGEFLNPKGSHGQGDVFLKLFVEEIRNHFGSDIILNDFNSLINDKICERTITSTNDWEDVSGGRIDIIIEDNNQILIIENKPGFQDQPYQLIRYNNYAKTKSPKKIILLYLTLDGRNLKKKEEPFLIKDIKIEGYNFRHNEISEYLKFKEEYIYNGNVHHCLYYPISFEIHIRNWIEKCLEKTYSLPIIRETLAQYLNLIKKITYQSTNEIMSDEIKKTILSSEENLKGAIAVFDSNPRQIICEEFFNRIKNKLGTNFDCENYNSYPIGKQFSGMYISKKFNIILWFGVDYDQLLLGIYENENWSKTVDITEHFNQFNLVEVLKDSNINGIVTKINELFESSNYS